MKHSIQRGFTLIELLVVITIIAILASLAVPTFSKIQEKGNITKGISNCRQVITTLRLYSSDNNGNYPDADTSKPTNANDAFKLMFVGGQADNEMIFGCPASQYGVPDGNIGASPTFSNALQSGLKENHWCLTAGLNDSASGTYPIVYENAKEAVWDPTWDPTAVGRGTKGRTWSGAKIIVGMNDSSVALQACDPGSGKLKPLGTAGTTDIFTQNTSSGGAAPPTVLDVED